MDIKSANQLFSELIQTYDACQRSIDRDLSTFMDPSRGVYSLIEHSAKKLNGQEILDTEPLEASRVWSSGLFSYVTNPTQKWFRAGVKRSDTAKKQDVIEYMAAVTQTMFEILSGSNLYEEILNMFSEYGTFSRGIFALVYDKKSLIRAYSFTAGSYFYDKDDRGEITTIGFLMRKTVNQLVSEFGIDNLPDDIKIKYKNKNNDYLNLRWLIVPNPEKVLRSLDHRGKNFLSLKWIETNTDQFVSVSGYDEFPVVIARFSPSDSTQIYGGKYPGWGALPASKQLQALCRSSNRIDAQNADPALLDFGGVKIANTYPGGISKFNPATLTSTTGKYGLEPIFPFRDPSYLYAKQALLQKNIQAWYFVDFFRMLANISQQMTLGEVQQRMAESLRVISPQIIQSESALKHMLDIILHILTSNYVMDGDKNVTILEYLIGPYPPELDGEEITWQFLGLLSILRKASETMGDEQLIAFATNLAGAINDPSRDPRDFLDVDEIFMRYASDIGKSDSLISEDEVMKKRAIRQQAMSQQQTQQDIANNLQAAQVMSQTSLSDNNALGAVLGQKP